VVGEAFEFVRTKTIIEVYDSVIGKKSIVVSSQWLQQDGVAVCKVRAAI
jgi:hypothetical protein